MRNLLNSSRLLSVALGLLFCLLLSSAPAQVTTYYWDVNNTDPGSGGPSPNGNWDDMNWTTDVTGLSPTANWVDGGFPVFAAGTDATSPYTITVASDHTIAGMQVLSNSVTISGDGRLLVADGMQGFTGTNLTLNAVLAGNGGFQSAPGNHVYLYGNNTFSGGVNLNLGSTYINNNNALGTGAISPIAGGANPSFSALYAMGSSPITLTNNYTIGTANAGIVFVTTATAPLTNSGDVDLQQTFYCRNGGPGTAPVTFQGGVMSGVGDVVLSANNSETIVMNGANTYSGKTSIGQGGGSRVYVNINSIQPVGSSIPNSLGLPADATTGQIDIGIGGSSGAAACALRYTGSGDTTDRIINNANPSGGMWLFADGAGALTLSGNITAVGGTAARTLTLQGGSKALNTISGAIQDSTGGANNQIAITKDGAGTWVLSGNNTFSGTLTIQGGGTLKIGADNTLPYGAGKANTTVSINGGGATTTLDLNGHSININGLALGASGQTAAVIDNTSGTDTYTLTWGNNNQGGTAHGNFNNSSGTLKIVKVGTGNITMKGTTGNYSGGLVMNGGFLWLENDANLGTGNGPLVINDTTGNGGLGAGIRNASGNGVVSPVVISSARQVQIGANGGCFQPAYGKWVTFNAKITGPGKIYSKNDGSGAGYILANTANDWQGGLNIGNGETGSSGAAVIFKLGASGVIPHGSSAGDVRVAGWGAKLDMNGFNNTINGLSGDANGQIDNTAAGTTSTLTVGDNNGGGTLSGTKLINSGSGSTLALTKIGSGTLTLTAVNTYKGATTIDGGTLALSGSGSLANSPTIAVAGGATFDVSALTTALTLGGSQTLQAGGTGGASATLATASDKGLTLGASSPLQFTAVDGTTAPLTIAGAGSLAIAAGNPITVTTTTALTPNSYKLVQIGSGNTTAVSGAPGALTVNGAGVSGAASLRMAGGELYLDVSVVEPIINSSSYDPATGCLTISGQNPGEVTQRSRLVYTDDLSATPVVWHQFTPDMTSTGTTFSFTITDVTAPAQRFYKVQNY